MKSVYLYGTLSPRIRARKSFLLVKGDYDALLGAENVQAVLRRLEGTAYRHQVASLLLEEFNLSKAEESLMEAYRREIDFIASHLKTREAADFFSQLSRIQELKCLADILKAIFLELPWDEASSYIHPYGRLGAAQCKALVDGKNLKQVLSLIWERPLALEVERLVKEVEDVSRRGLEVEITVTRYGMMEAWKKLNEVKGKDRFSLKLMGFVLDAANIMAVLRMKKLGFKPEEIGWNLISAYYRISREGLEKASAAPTEKEAVKVFASGYYVNQLSPLLSAYEVKGDLSIFETVFKRFHAGECERVFISPFFHLGEVLAYLYLKLYEVQDLIAILIAKQEGLPAEKTKPHLVLHQPPYPL
ncbi:V-type ATPase subunit [Candidatus Hecatella orcuttiae]|jgi:V/A-type H+-transporting ATPase subunit C|uniref:V-type ATPase subunit n=1 Tax=Candidatus Hecatella orcuttiae TaxID=1935119 RepID=UPI0028681462|nr:V-type ATPase subunit [Candidatus Hecatella orcuttiae]